MPPKAAASATKKSSHASYQDMITDAIINVSLFASFPTLKHGATCCEPRRARAMPPGHFNTVR